MFMLMLLVFGSYATLLRDWDSSQLSFVWLPAFDFCLVAVFVPYISRSALPPCVLFSFVFVRSLTVNNRFTLLLRLLPRAYMHTTPLYITGKLPGIQSLQQSKLSFAIEEADEPKYRQQGDVM